MNYAVYNIMSQNVDEVKVTFQYWSKQNANDD